MTNFISKEHFLWFECSVQGFFFLIIRVKIFRHFAGTVTSQIFHDITTIVTWWKIRLKREKKNLERNWERIFPKESWNFSLHIRIKIKRKKCCFPHKLERSIVNYQKSSVVLGMFVQIDNTTLKTSLRGNRKTGNRRFEQTLNRNFKTRSLKPLLKRLASTLRQLSQ